MYNEIVKQFGREIIIAAGRSNRPKLITKPLSNCPFCPGNEHMTPPETGRIEQNGNWTLRSFENKYPVLSPSFPKAYGKHEVIVETHEHQGFLQNTDTEQYLNFCFQRMDALKDEKIKYVLLFKNHGINAGASIAHEHSQIIALPEIPPTITTELKQFKKENPLEKPKNVVFENDSTFCMASPVPRYPYELWIAPKEKVSTGLNEHQTKDFAETLKVALTKLHTLLENPDYCFFYHYYPKETEFHLHLEIIPRISRWAGLEFGSGIIVNSIAPNVVVEELSKI
ncbi:DUF4931 domain-containing protein [archaeon]|nr:DUF4931 domain-containing protein [archaeon]